CTRFEISLSGSIRSPNTIAFDGQVCWQAVTTAPSRTLRFSSFAASFARRMRCTQNVHFSITPLSRTVTSGLSCQLSGSGNLYENQLKARTLYRSEEHTSELQ